MIILTLTLKQARKLDVYFEYEEKIMSKSTLDKSLLDMISDPDGEYFKSELCVNIVKRCNKPIHTIKNVYASCAGSVKEKSYLLVLVAV